MKSFLRIALLLACSLLVFSCKSARLEKAAQEELEQYITLPSNPIGGGTIISTNTEYKSSNLCILSVKVKPSEVFSHNIHNDIEYVFYKDQDAKYYACLNTSEAVFLDKKSYQEACEGQIYANAPYDHIIAHRAVSCINMKGYCVEDHNAEVHLFLPKSTGDFEYAKIEDQFKPAKEGKCLNLKTRGTFSCEMTKGSALQVSLFLLKDAVTFRFTEFLTMTNVFDEPIELVATCQDGTEYKFNVYNSHEGYTRFDTAQAAKFIEMMGKGGDIEVVGNLTDATYNFRIYANGFAEAINTL